MTAYEQLSAGRPWHGMPIIAVLDPDGHMAVCPLAHGLLDDDPARELVAEVLNDLLEARKISKERGSDADS